MSAYDFNIDKSTIENLFKSNFFQIPEYQRDYVWDDEHVESYFDDIMYNFENGNGLNSDKQKEWSKYYMGNIVLSGGEFSSGKTLSIIDGQQRLTTTSIFLKVLSNIINDHVNPADYKENVISKYKERFDSLLQDFNTSTGENLNRIEFLYPENRIFMDELMKSNHVSIEKINENDLTKSQKNLLKAYQTLYPKFLKKFIQTTSNTNLMMEFFSYFTNYVIFSVVTTNDLGNALLIFQNLNNRGIGLTPTDLLKNLLIMNAANQKQVDNIVGEWKTFIELIEIGNNLNKNITTDRFIRHFLMARYNKTSIKVNEVFPYVENHKSQLKITEDPSMFLRELSSKAKDYITFYNGKDRDGNDIEALQNMRTLRFFHHMLLLLFTDSLPKDRFEDFCIKIENLLFVYSITGKLTKDFESLFCNWAQKICKINSETKYVEFLENNYTPELLSQKKKFIESFKNLSQDGQTQYRQKYILAKLGQLLETAVSGNGTATSRHAIESNYKEIEHILPQTPKADLKDDFIKDLEEGETYEDYLKRFGNLTLLDKPINIIANNKFFNEKKQYYTDPNQTFKLTYSICEEIKLGNNNSLLNRVVYKVGLKPFGTWCKNSIIQRQKQLTEMALYVWGFYPLP